MSNRKNKIFEKRAHDLDGYLIKMLNEVKASAENHAWNVSDRDEMDSEYMKKMSESVRFNVKEYSGYRDSLSEAVPFYPIPLDGAFFDIDDVPMCVASSFEEAKEKVVEFMEEEWNGDSRAE